MTPTHQDVPYANASDTQKLDIDAAGSTDLSVMDEQAKAPGCAPSDQTHNSADSSESLYLGAPVQTVPDLVQQSNPIPYIDGADPPFLIQKGDQEIARFRSRTRRCWPTSCALEAWMSSTT